MRLVRWRRRTGDVSIAVGCAVLGAALLPASASPWTSGGAAGLAGEVTVTVSAPATAAVGEPFDYVVTLAYNGALTGATPEITVTDPLPAGVVFQGGWGISPSGVCPTRPPPGQSGTLRCSVTFDATRTTITLTIKVTPVQAGTATNTVTLSTGDAGSASTTIEPGAVGPPGPTSPRPAPSGSVAANLEGPSSVVLPASGLPTPFRYTLRVTYNGALAGPNDHVYVDVTVELPPQVLPRSWGMGADSSGDCPTRPAAGPGLSGGTYVCRLNYHVTQTRTNTLFFEVRPFDTGVATNTVRLATGEALTVSTTITRTSPPPAAAPEPVPGPAAAPTRTVVETFTQQGETETQSATIAPSAKTTQVALTWPDADSSFDATGFRIVRDGQVVARAPQSVTAKVRPGKLRVSKRRTARSLDVRIKGLKPGRLIYKIVARRLDGRTRVRAKVRQSRR